METSKATVTMPVDEYYKMRQEMERMQAERKDMFILKEPGEWNKNYAIQHDSTCAVCLELNLNNPIIKEALETAAAFDPAEDTPEDVAEVEEIRDNTDKMYVSAIAIRQYKYKNPNAVTEEDILPVPTEVASEE